MLGWFLLNMVGINHVWARKYQVKVNKVNPCRGFYSESIFLCTPGEIKWIGLGTSAVETERIQKCNYKRVEE